MHRAIGIYAIIAENKAHVPTVNIVGEGDLKEGPVDGTSVARDEEGIVNVGMPRLGIVAMVSLDVPGSKEHADDLDANIKTTKRIANKENKRFELVYFGPTGREHVRWIG